MMTLQEGAIPISFQQVMPSPLFLDDASWTRFEAILYSWIDTPYKHMAMVRGRGADCAHYIAACWMEFGVLTRVERAEYYPKDWYLCENQPEMVIDGLHRHFNAHAGVGYSISCLKPDLKTLIRGDVLTFSTGIRGMSNHAAVYLGAKSMIHAMPNRGVTIFPLGQAFDRRVTHIFRVLRGA